MNLKWHIQWKIKELQLFSISLAICIDTAYSILYSKCYIKSKYAIQHLSDNFYYNIHLVSSYLYIYKEHKTCYDSLAFILLYICFSYLLQFYIFWHHCYIIYYLKYICICIEIKEIALTLILNVIYLLQDNNNEWNVFYCWIYLWFRMRGYLHCSFLFIGCKFLKALV